MSIFEFLLDFIMSFIVGISVTINKFLYSGSVRFFWLYIVIGLLIAWFNYSKIKTKSNKDTFFQTLFRKDFWSSKSVLNDYGMLLINAVLVLLFFHTILDSYAVISDWIVSFFRQLGVTGEVSGGTTVVAGLALTLSLFIVRDFMHFYMHYLLHRLPILWEFHKIHHSARFLNFVTSERTHPVETLLFASAIVIAFAVVNGVFFAFFGDDLTVLTVMGANFFVFAGNMIGGAMRHSPFPVSFGPRLEQWLISPAMHHIHHSEEEKHFDKNMGGALSIWDRMFGTWAGAEENYDYRYGLGDGSNDYESLTQLYVTPFVKLKDMYFNNNDEAGETPKTTSETSKVVSNIGLSLVYVGLFLALLYSALLLPHAFAGGEKRDVTSVKMQQNAALSTKLAKAVHQQLDGETHSVLIEELTFAEIQYLLGQGTDSVIIPTGGTEQNGLHMITGKHNFIVKHTAEQIAQQAGKTLVAPVMAYVPEGDIGTGEGHMGFAGTLSLPNDVFEKVLENTIRSLKKHGFKAIYLLGDSGGNQASQGRVSARLNKRWHGQSVKVVQLADYYKNNNQDRTLLKLGISKDALGRHAGLRDTAELIYVKPEGVRTKMLAQLDELRREYRLVTALGNPALATAEIGKAMIDLKIAAGLAQIRKERANHTN